jgi:hypothetical protein
VNVRRGRVILVLGLVLLAAGPLWVAREILTSSDPVSSATLWAGLLAPVAIAVPVITLALPRLWQSPARLEPSPGPTLDALAQALTTRWQEAANRDGLLTPAPIPLNWSPVSGTPTAPGAFSPLPGVQEMSQRVFNLGGRLEHLYRLYGSTRTGRLVVSGAPGSGKTASSILLCLHALDQRSRSDVPTSLPVPVILDLGEWDPASESTTDWLIRKMTEVFPPLQAPSGAKELLAIVHAGQVAFLLDGFDEIPEAVQPKVMRALNRAPARIVVFSGSDALERVGKRARLSGAVVVRLDPVDGNDAADYLERALDRPGPSEHPQLLRAMRDPGQDQFTQDLRTPLSITLLRDTLDTNEDIAYLLNQAGESSPEVARYLMGLLIPAAYSPQDGVASSRFGEVQALRTLTLIAAILESAGVRQFGWWEIRYWAPSGPRLLLSTTLIVVLSTSIGGAVGVALGAAVDGVVGGSLAGTIIAVLRRRGSGVPEVSTSWSLITCLRRLPATVAASTVATSTSLLISGPTWMALPVGLCTLLFGGLASGTSVSSDWSRIVYSPRSVWRRDQQSGIRAAAIGGVLFGGLGGAALWVALESSVSGVAYFLASLFTYGLVYPEAWETRLAFLQFAIRFRTPFRLMEFLEEAADLRILRTHGPKYEFRHELLRKQLASQYRANLRNRSPQASEKGSPSATDNPDDDADALVSD